MGELTIRLDDAKLLEALAEMASTHNHAVEAEVEAVVRRAVEERQRRLELVRRSQEIRAMTPRAVTQTDSLEIIREMREERTHKLGG